MDVDEVIVVVSGTPHCGEKLRASTADAIPVRLSMAGFTPSEVRVPAGQAVALELWTTDTAPHLEGGVHTVITDELGIREELPAAGVTGESRAVIRAGCSTTRLSALPQVSSAGSTSRPSTS